MVRIPINNNNEKNPNAGESVVDTSGGEFTAPRDAGIAADDVQQMREEEVETWGQQAAGEVDTQTDDLRPSPANPGEGLPHSTVTGDDVQDDATNEDGQQSSANADDAGADNTATARAASEHDEKFLRLAADFENYKRQAARQVEEAREKAARGILEDLFPVFDNFDRAVDAAKNAKDVESLRIGIDYIGQQLHETLRSLGVEPLSARGQKFDPLQHEALAEVSDSGAEPGTVIEETQRGYSYKGKILRPALVKVAS